jgi:hypothetical protein
MDKIGDTISYTFLLIWVIFYEKSPNIKPFTIFLIILYMFRLAGTCIFWDTGNTDYFLKFPNFFPEVLLLLSIFDYLKISYIKYHNLYIIGIIIVMLLKIPLEYRLHGNKEEVKRIDTIDNS